MRANSLFVSVLRYIVDLLVWDKGDCLPDDMQSDGKPSDQYHCMLFNDEVHTYEQVTDSFLLGGDGGLGGVGGLFFLDQGFGWETVSFFRFGRRGGVTVEHA